MGIKIFGDWTSIIDPMWEVDSASCVIADIIHKRSNFDYKLKSIL